MKASLSFIGTGITSVNTPTWGNMLSEGKALLLSGHWWVTFFPGLFILVTTLSLNILAEGLTDSFASPRIKTRVNVQADEDRLKGEGRRSRHRLLARLAGRVAQGPPRRAEDRRAQPGGLIGCPPRPRS